DRGAGIDVAHHGVQALDHGAWITARRRAGHRGVDRLLVVQVRERRGSGERGGEQQQFHFFFLLVVVLRRFAAFFFAFFGCGTLSTASLKTCTSRSTAAACDAYSASVRAISSA